MYPLFEPIDGLIIYSFGLTLTICFFLFLGMLKKLSGKFYVDFSFFTKNILRYFLSVFIFSRLFYVFDNWYDLNYIESFYEFFIMNDYNFSLSGAIFGFLSILYINLYTRKEKLSKYIDPLVITFVFILFVGYIGSFLGGQVYGNPTSFGIEVQYNNYAINIPYSVPIFPLALVYSFFSFVLFCTLYISSMYIKIRGLIGYFGLIIFSSLILIFEGFSGKNSFFSDTIGINLMQSFAILLIIFCVYNIFMIYSNPEKIEEEVKSSK